jgi:hypothetical protein
MKDSLMFEQPPDLIDNREKTSLESIIPMEGVR